MRAYSHQIYKTSIGIIGINKEHEERDGDEYEIGLPPLSITQPALIRRVSRHIAPIQKVRGSPKIKQKNTNLIIKKWCLFLYNFIKYVYYLCFVLFF